MNERVLAEGKTKIVLEHDDPALAIILHKDDITAGDGARRNTLPGKGELAGRTTANVFRSYAQVHRAGDGTLRIRLVSGGAGERVSVSAGEALAAGNWQIGLSSGLNGAVMTMSSGASRSWSRVAATSEVTVFPPPVAIAKIP